MPAPALAPLLRTDAFGRRLHYFAELPSTQNAAQAGAAAGEPHGALYWAETQTAGRGRHGHTWISPPGAGLYFTLLLRPEQSAQSLLGLTLAAGLAIADAVLTDTGLLADIRWPNDLLLRNRKFCGILLEAGSDTDCLFLGVGINLAAVALPAELEPIATSLQQECGRPVPPLPFLATVLAQLERRYADFLARGMAGVRAEFEARSSFARGRSVTVGVGSEQFEGITEGLDSAGFLLVRRRDGSRQTIYSGDVRPR